jgi:DEAD/DEAH box helicase
MPPTAKRGAGLLDPTTSDDESEEWNRIQQKMKQRPAAKVCRTQSSSSSSTSNSTSSSDGVDAYVNKGNQPIVCREPHHSTNDVEAVRNARTLLATASSSDSSNNIPTVVRTTKAAARKPSSDTSVATRPREPRNDRCDFGTDISDDVLAAIELVSAGALKQTSVCASAKATSRPFKDAARPPATTSKDQNIPRIESAGHRSMSQSVTSYPGVSDADLAALDLAAMGTCGGTNNDIRLRGHDDTPYAADNDTPYAADTSILNAAECHNPTSTHRSTLQVSPRARVPSFATDATPTIPTAVQERPNPYQRPRIDASTHHAPAASVDRAELAQRVVSTCRTRQVEGMEVHTTPRHRASVPPIDATNLSIEQVEHPNAQEPLLNESSQGALCHGDNYQSPISTFHISDAYLDEAFGFGDQAVHAAQEHRPSHSALSDFDDVDVDEAFGFGFHAVSAAQQVEARTAEALEFGAQNVYMALEHLNSQMPMIEIDDAEIDEAFGFGDQAAIVPPQSQTIPIPLVDIDETEIDEAFGFGPQAVPTAQVTPQGLARGAEIDPSKYSMQPWDVTLEPIIHSFTTRNRPISSRRTVAVTEVFEMPVSKMWKAKFDTFNQLQSETANMLAYSDAHVVVSAPTGAGKTAVFEQAVARFFSVDLQNSAETKGQPLQVSKLRKIVYVSPSKALIEERYADWSKCLSGMGLGIEITVVTGDGDPTESFHDIASAHFILTTPEKWDSLTRRWTENFLLFASVKLFMVDEVHLLADGTRGCCLEATICRMKSIQLVAAQVRLTPMDIARSR